MNMARIDNGIVAEILVPVPGFSFAECFPADLLEQCVNCDDSVMPGMLYDGTSFVVLTPDAAATIRAEMSALEASISPRMWREDALGSSATMAFGPDDPRTGKSASQYIAWVDMRIGELRARLSG